MSKIRYLFTAAALAACALAPTVAMTKVLFLSTNEKASNERYIVNNILYDFQQAAGAVNVIDRRGALSDTLDGPLVSDSDLTDVDVVVVVARNTAINNSAYTILEKWMKGKDASDNDFPKSKDLKFIIFTEGGSSSGKNAQNFAGTIQSSILSGSEVSFKPLENSLYTTVPLQDGTYFKSSFTGINAGINGGDTYGNENEVRVQTYGVMQCIPDKDVIFSYNQDGKRCIRNNGKTTADDANHHKARDCWEMMEDAQVSSKICQYNSTTCKDLSDSTKLNAYLTSAQSSNNGHKNQYNGLNDKNTAFSFAIPQWQSNSGKGACILFVADGNLLDAQGQDYYCKEEGQWAGAKGGGGDTAGLPTDNTTTRQCEFRNSAGGTYNNPGRGNSEHGTDIFSHVNQRKYVASKYLAAARGSVCGQSHQTECTKWDINDNTQNCTLMAPSVNTKPADIDITKGGACAKDLMWCDSKEENRKDRCDTAAGEDPTTHCCTTKAAPSGGAAAVPTTGWPALLGLSALLPLLATRRRRK